jgi:hypothetical protein
MVAEALEPTGVLAGQLICSVGAEASTSCAPHQATRGPSRAALRLGENRAARAP